MPPKKNDITISKDTKKVNNKQTKLSKESKELKIEESENEESEESENEESEESEESENEESKNEESENEEKDKSKKSVKEKKVKKTKEENINELTQLIVDFKKNESEYKLIQENFHKNEKARSEIGKQLSRIVSLLQKSKREGNNNSGFNKETPVPPKLIKYLSLDNDVLMSRPKLGSLLYQKFKSENLTNGQNITLDKNTAKIFGKEKDYEFNFKQMQTFIKEINDEAFPKS
jgi:hypothetical protein